MFDSNISEAIGACFEERYEQYCSSDRKHRFSWAYRIKRRRIIRSFEKSHSLSRKSLPVRKLRYAMILVLIAVTALAMFTGYSLWRSIGQYNFNVYSDHSLLYIDNNAEVKTSIEEIYVLPDELGYTMTEYHANDRNVVIYYQKDGILLKLCQSTNFARRYVNTEYGMPEEINVKNNIGYYIRTKSEAMVSWIEDGYLFTMYGDFDKNTFVELAESTKIR